MHILNTTILIDTNFIYCLKQSILLAVFIYIVIYLDVSYIKMHELNNIYYT